MRINFHVTSLHHALLLVVSQISTPAKEKMSSTITKNLGLINNMWRGGLAQPLTSWKDRDIKKIASGTDVDEHEELVAF